MKKIFQIAFIFAFIFASQSLLAQHPHHGHHGPRHDGRLIEKFKADLNLTEDQENALTALKEEAKKQREAIHEEMKSEDADREAIHEQMKKFRKSHHEKAMAILTAEQKEILEQKKEAFHKERKAKHEEMRSKIDFEGMKAELQAFHDNKVQPVMLAQRAKLEKEISADDKATLAELRTTFAALKKEHKAKREEFKKSGERPSRELREKHMEEMKAKKEAHSEERETMKALVEKYDDNIEALFKEIEGDMAKWEEEKKAIHEKYMPEKPEGFKGRRGEGMHHHPRHRKGGKGMHRHGDHQGMKNKKKAHFLLLDPSEATTPAQALASVKNVTTFPNPASNANTLKYEVTNPGNILIELRTEGGDVVKVVESSFKEAGTYSIEVDFSNVRSGVYYYTIVEGGQVISEKVIVSK